MKILVIEDKVSKELPYVFTKGVYYFVPSESSTRAMTMDFTLDRELGRPFPVEFYYGNCLEGLNGL